jgi:hypothetical protein
MRRSRNLTLCREWGVTYQEHAFALPPTTRGKPMASTAQIARVVGSAWRLNVGWWALRIGLGVGAIIAGIDKYFNKLADWECI